MKIVCDTNVLVSGTLFAGPPRRVLTMASRGEVTNCSSPAMLREVEDVLARPKFGLRPDQVAGILALFRDTFEIVHPVGRIRAVAADPADNMALEAALAATAAVIVSGDRHLLALGAWAGVRIVTPADLPAEQAGRGRKSIQSPGRGGERE